MFYGTHFSRAAIKAGEVDQGYRKLREEFGKISKLTDNKQVFIEKPIITIPSNGQSLSLLPDKNKIVKDKRIIEGKLRKVEIFNGQVLRVFGDDGSIIEDRSAKFGDKLLLIEPKVKVEVKLDDEKQISSQIESVVVSECIEKSDTEYIEKDEKYKEFTKFYEDFLNQIIDGITTSKTGNIAAPISNIIDDSKKVVHIIDGNEKKFLKGMNIYFDTRGIKTDMDVDDKYITFKKKDGKDKNSSVT